MFAVVAVSVVFVAADIILAVVAVAILVLKYPIFLYLLVWKVLRNLSTVLLYARNKLNVLKIIIQN